jgi:hypothetical protein
MAPSGRVVIPAIAVGAVVLTCVWGLAKRSSKIAMALACLSIFGAGGLLVFFVDQKVESNRSGLLLPASLTLTFVCAYSLFDLWSAWTARRTNAERAVDGSHFHESGEGDAD